MKCPRCGGELIKVQRNGFEILFCSVCGYEVSSVFVGGEDDDQGRENEKEA